MMFRLYGSAIVLLVLISAPTPSHCSTDNSTSDSSAQSDANSFNRALNPLYSMSKGFLHVVFPKGAKVDTIGEAWNQIDESSQNNSPLDGWQLTRTVLDGYAGYATCVVIGLLLVVLMPLIGLFCCCCRLCNNCGGKKYDYDPKNAKCKRATCALLLFIFTIMTLGGMIMVFFSAAQLHTITQDGTLAKEIHQKASAVSAAVNQTIDQDLQATAKVALDDLEKKILDTLNGTGHTVAEEILRRVNISQPIEQLIADVRAVNGSLDGFLSSLQSWESVRVDMKANFTEANVTAASLTCGSDCEQVQKNIKNLLDNLDTLDSTQTKDDIEDKKKQFDDIPNLQEAYQQAKDNVNETAQRYLTDALKDIKQQMKDAKENVLKSLTDGTYEAKKAVADVVYQVDTIDTYLGYEEKAFDYWWYGNIALGSIIGLIVLLYLIGVMTTCTERPGTDANCCNRGCGANFLLAGVGFSFIFYALLMLVTCLLFAAGALVTSHGCWSIQEPKTLAESLKSNARLNFNIGGNITLHTVLQGYSDCLDGKPIEELLNGLNIDGLDRASIEKLIQENLGESKIKEQIGKVSIDTSSITLLPESVNNSLIELSNYNSPDLSSLDSYEEEIGNFSQELKSFESDLQQLKNIVPSQDDKPRLDDIISFVQSAQNDAVPRMNNSLDEITASLKSLDSNITQVKSSSSKLVGEIKKAQDDIRTNGNAVVQDALNGLAGGLPKTVHDSVNDSLQKLFGTKCYAVANAVRDVGNVFCETALNPFNGLWFSLGWCLAMLIPCIILALVLSSYFRRELPYEKDYHRDDFSSYIDHSTSSPSRVQVLPLLPPSSGYRENIPLESHGAGTYPHYHGDVTNQGFRDDYGRALYHQGGRGDIKKPKYQ